MTKAKSKAKSKPKSKAKVPEVLEEPLFEIPPWLFIDQCDDVQQWWAMLKAWVTEAKAELKETEE